MTDAVYIEALKTIRGDYGAGEQRQQMMAEKGLDYKRVQSKVNDIYKHSPDIIKKLENGSKDLIKVINDYDNSKKSAQKTSQNPVQKETKAPDMNQSKAKYKSLDEIPAQKNGDFRTYDKNNIRVTFDKVGIKEAYINGHDVLKDYDGKTTPKLRAQLLEEINKSEGRTRDTKFLSKEEMQKHNFPKSIKVKRNPIEQSIDADKTISDTDKAEIKDTVNMESKPEELKLDNSWENVQKTTESYVKLIKNLINCSVESGDLSREAANSVCTSCDSILKSVEGAKAGFETLDKAQDMLIKDNLSKLQDVYKAFTQLGEDLKRDAKESVKETAESIKEMGKEAKSTIKNAKENIDNIQDLTKNATVNGVKGLWDTLKADIFTGNEAKKAIKAFNVASSIALTQEKGINKSVKTLSNCVEKFRKKEKSIEDKIKKLEADSRHLIGGRYTEKIQALKSKLTSIRNATAEVQSQIQQCTLDYNKCVKQITQAKEKSIDVLNALEKGRADLGLAMDKRVTLGIDKVKENMKEVNDTLSKTKSKITNTMEKTSEVVKKIDETLSR